MRDPTWNDLDQWGKRAVEWGLDYHRTKSSKPVRAQVAPGDIARQLADHPPESGEAMDVIFDDFDHQDLADQKIHILQQDALCGTLTLDALSPKAHEDLAGSLVALTPKMAQQVAHQTQGNPLFAMHLVGDLIEQGHLVPHAEGFDAADGHGPATWPKTMDLLWQQRMGRLLPNTPHDLHKVLEIAAAFEGVIDPKLWDDVCQKAYLFFFFFKLLFIFFGNKAD